MAKRTVLVTGGSRGIGKEIADLFRATGANVVTPTRQELNLASADSVADFERRIHEARLQFDILVNNAGINYIAKIDDVTDAGLREMVEVNLISPFKLLRAVARHMKSQGWGRILNISSIFGIVSKEGRSVYTMTKSGLNGLTTAAAAELSPYGVFVNSVCPGYVETDLTYRNNSPADIERIVGTIPARRLAKPSEIAKYCLFLCSEENTYLTGQNVVIDGGFLCQ